MIGDTLSHVTIAGVALGFLIEVYPLAAGLVFAVLASFAIEKRERHIKVMPSCQSPLLCLAALRLLRCFHPGNGL